MTVEKAASSARKEHTVTKQQKKERAQLVVVFQLWRDKPLKGRETDICMGLNSEAKHPHSHRMNKIPSFPLSFGVEHFSEVWRVCACCRILLSEQSVILHTLYSLPRERHRQSMHFLHQLDRCSGWFIILLQHLDLSPIFLFGARNDPPDFT